MRKVDSMTLEMKTSPWLKWFMVCVHVAAGLAALLAGLTWPWRAILLLGIGLSLWRAWPRAGLRTLRLSADGQLAIGIGDAWSSSFLLPDSLVWPWLVIVRHRPASGKRTATMIFLPGSLAPDDFRRLRVWLRWRAKPAAAMGYQPSR